MSLSHLFSPINVSVLLSYPKLLLLPDIVENAVGDGGKSMVWSIINSPLVYQDFIDLSSLCSVYSLPLPVCYNLRDDLSLTLVTMMPLISRHCLLHFPRHHTFLSTSRIYILFQIDTMHHRNCP